MLADTVSAVMNRDALVYAVGFGLVALVAMTPLITIQLLGFKGIITNKLQERRALLSPYL